MPAAACRSAKSDLKESIAEYLEIRILPMTTRLANLLGETVSAWRRAFLIGLAALETLLPVMAGQNAERVLASVQMRGKFA